MQVTETLGNLERETDQASERWFSDHAQCALVQDLDRSSEQLVNRLRTILDGS
jgi:hypothetical protein